MKNIRLSLAAKIAISYLLVGGMFFLLSDLLAKLIIKNPIDLAIINTYKGWLFTLITGLALFYYLRRENIIHKSDRRDFSNIFEQAPEGIFQSTSDGHFIRVNPAMARMYGYDSPDEMVSEITDIGKQIHVISRMHGLFTENLIRNGFVEKFESRNYRKDGTIIWTSTSARCVLDEKKKLSYYEGFVVDITKRKLTEKVLQDSEVQYRRLVEHSPFAVAVHSQGVLVYVNEAGVKLIGANSAEELAGISIMEFVHPDSSSRVLKRLQDLQKGLEAPAMEEKFVRRDGSTINVEVTAYPFVYQNSSAVQVVVRDLTEQKRAEEALRANEEKLQGIIDHTQNIYYSRTTDGVLTYISAQARNILGYEPEPMLANWQDYLTDHPINQRGIELAQKASVTGINQGTYILELKARDGKHVWVEVRESPVIRENKTIAIVGALTDITERKKGEEELERRLAELTVLQAVAMAGSQSYSIDEVIKRSTQIVSGMLYPDNCGVLLLNEAGNALNVHSSYRGLMFDDAPSELPLSRGIIGQVAGTGQPIRLNDVTQHTAYVESTTGIQSELCVPIRVNEKIIGVFNVESKKINAFAEEDERVLNAIAGTLGTAIARIRLLNTEQRRRREAENLREATAALTKTIELDKLFDIILESLGKLVSYTSASIEVIDLEQAEIVASRGLPERHENIGKKYGFRPGKWGIDIDRPIIIPDVRADERFEKFEGAEYIRGWMGVPMLAQDNLIGYLNLESDEVDFYTEAQADLVQIFANQAATAIQNAHRFQSETKRRNEAENLQVAATAVTSSLDVEEVLQTILIALKEVTPYDSTSVLLLEGNQVRIRAAKGLPNPTLALDRLFPANNPLLQEIKKSGKAIILEDAQKDAHFEKWASADNVHGWLGVPLIARGQIIGYITLDSYTVGAFNENDAALAQTFAHQAAVAIDNAHLFTRLQETFTRLQETNEELSKAYDTTLEGWGKALELRDKETQGHTMRVTELTLRLARQIGKREPELTLIRRGVQVHDIGKMGVPDHILHKKTPLTKREWAVMHEHPRYAFDLLYPITYLRPALDIAYCHHERWDGAGYPRGLKGEEIPLAARIFAVVDVWDALTSNRSYRKAWSRKKVMKYIRDEAGNHFDPQIVESFLKMMDQENK
jgi:PAS domain S-box-containing protein